MNPKLFLQNGLLLLGGVGFFAASASAQTPREGFRGVTSVPPKPRTVLPFDDFRFAGSVGRTVADSDPPEFPRPRGRPRVRRTSFTS